MNIEQFWQLIEASRTASGGDCDRQVDALTSLLLEQSTEEIVEFDRLFYKLHEEAYRNDLWAATYIMNGGCSDDGSVYFRSWLIGQGKDVYEAALRDPESLASVVERQTANKTNQDFECEHLAYAAFEA